MLALLAIPPSPALSQRLDQSGRWVATPSLDFSSTHTVVLREPGTDATKVFMFGEAGSKQTMKLWRFLPGDTNLLAPTTVGPRSSLVPLPHPNGLQSDLFCTGHATLPDGRMLMVGGAWIPLSPCREVYTLDPAWQSGVPGAPTTPWAESAEMAVQRWYATATPLPDGTVLASAGTMCSQMIGFGGLARGVTMDTTWRVLQPLELSGRYSWGDTTAAPGDTCTVGCKPGRFRDLRWSEDYTRGRYPPGRDAHVFVGDPAARCIAFGGRTRLANGSYAVLGDIWHLYSSPADDDSSHGWSLMEQVGDPSLPGGQNLPGPRWGCAATWAGTEERAETQIRETTGALICYVHGGRDAAGNVLGDLWRGERRLVRGPRYQWAWTRVSAGDASTRRYGHTMVFDPGVPGPGAPRARLLIFGGWRSPTSLADPAKLLVVGVGSESAQPPAWRELTPEGQAPPARAWHAMTPKWRDSGSDEREYFMFGGESGSRDSAATPVPPAVWVLERPDVSLADGDRYEWSQLPIAGQGPSGRSRPAMAYSADGGTLVVVGGDTTGTALPGGQTNAIWTMQGLYYYYNDILTWRRPYERHFHPAPPPIAGMGLVAIGGNRARIARSLERFTLRGNTATGAECGPLLGQWETVTTPDPESARPIADYPNIYVLPDGRLFNAGPPVSMDTRRSRSRYKRFFDLGSRRWEDEPGADQVDTTFFGTSVMVRPGVILRAGNSDGTGTGETQTIDMSHGRWPKWRDYHPARVRPELVARTHHNLTLLPTGDVLATGGVGTDDDVVGTAVKAPQIWYAKDERWSDPHPASGEALAPDPRIRNYHSTAVLLPDARILTAGGEHPASDEDQMSASVFEPPYLFRANGSYAPRPRVRSAPGALIYGGVFTLQLADTARVRTIRSVALMRPGAATHGFDQGQRYVPLEFVAEPSPPRLLVRSPADANLAPPGDYMLFVVDRVGVDAPAVPSVARWVRVLASAPAPVDSADVTAPRGGAWLGLRDSVAIDDGPGTPPVRLVWRAPADDDTLQFTGRARAYDLRYAPDAGAPADFGRWTRVASADPGAVGSVGRGVVAGLSTARWYRFGVRAVGDAADTSSVSNVLVTKPFESGGGAGSVGDEYGLSASDAGSFGRYTAPVSPTPRNENTVFAGVAPGSGAGPFAREALPLVGAPRKEGDARLVYVRQGGYAHGLVLDRVSLVRVDHAPGLEAAATATGSILVGERRPAVLVIDGSGVDRTAGATGTSPEPVRVDSGSTLTLILPGREAPSEDVLLIEAAWGSPRGHGISVRVPGAGGWTEYAVLHPRRGWSTHAVVLRGATTLRLRVQDAVAIRFIGRLASASFATGRPLPLVSAASRTGSNRTAEVAERDGRSAIVVPGDTLSLAFRDLPEDPSQSRSWFLALEGQPLLPGAAVGPDEGRTSSQSEPALTFRLYQNTPNPFATTTRIAFDLPAPAETRMEIFDLQGRAVRRFAARREAGRHTIEWDLLDGAGRRVAPGVYTYRLLAGAFAARRKLVVMP